MYALETEDKIDLEKGSTPGTKHETPDHNVNSKYMNEPEIYQMDHDLSMQKVTHKNR